MWTLLAGPWLWVLLPVAIHYQRKARREAEESGGLYVWPNSLWNRPVLFYLVVLVCSFGLVLLMAFVGILRRLIRAGGSRRSSEVLRLENLRLRSPNGGKADEDH